MKPTFSTVERLLISMAEVQQIVGLRSRQSVYNKLRSDPTFPKPRRMGPHNIAFVRTEIERWVASLPVAELDGFDAVTRRRVAAAARTAGAMA